MVKAVCGVDFFFFEQIYYVGKYLCTGLQVDCYSVCKLLWYIDALVDKGEKMALMKPGGQTKGLMAKPTQRAKEGKGS